MTDDDFPEIVGRRFRRAAWLVLGGVLGVAAWAAMAPLATSFTVNGVLVSAPVIELQALDGGLVESVSVRPLERVQAGREILRFDSRDTRLALEALRRQRAVLLAEAGAGVDQQSDADLPEPAVLAARAAMQADRAAHAATLARLQAEAEAARHARDLGAADLAAREALLAAAVAREARIRALVERAAMPQADLLAAEEARLAAEVDLAQAQATQAAAADRIAILERQRAETEAAHVARVEAAARDARRGLLQLDREIALLEGRLARATVRAPVGGVVTALSAETAGRVARPGETVVSLAGELDSVEVTIEVPPRLIDQVRVGQTGQLRLLSLPQRLVAPVEARVTALAPAAARDAEGRPVHYAARLSVSADRLAAAFDAAGQAYYLVRDMPVAVQFEGRATTVLSYLTSPLSDLVTHAIEDG
jgi:HlyD family type I secretion membrane fusion protein